MAPARLTTAVAALLLCSPGHSSLVLARDRAVRTHRATARWLYVALLMPVSYLLYDGVAGWVVYAITYGWRSRSREDYLAPISDVQVIHSSIGLGEAIIYLRISEAQIFRCSNRIAHGHDPPPISDAQIFMSSTEQRALRSRNRYLTAQEYFITPFDLREATNWPSISDAQIFIRFDRATRSSGPATNI